MSDSTSMQTESTAAAPAVETSTPSAAESSVKLESSASSNGSTPSTLEDKIIQQVEFYMSEYNLPRDPHLKQLYDSNDSAVPIATIATFNRMKQLTEDLAIVIAALKKSTKLVVSSDDKMISRSEPLPEKLKTTRNSIYVEGLPLKATLDELQQFFGNIKGADLKCVRMLRDPAFKLEQKGKNEKTEGEQPASKKLKTEDKEESKSDANETENANANAAAQSDADATNTNVKTEDSSSTTASASDSSSSSSSSSSSVEKDKRLDRKLLFNGNAFVEFGSSDEVTAVVAQALIYPGQSEPLKLMTKVAFFNIQQKEKREKEEEQKLAKKGKFARKTKSDVDNENDAKEGKNGDEMEEDKLGNNKKRKHDGDGNDDKAAKLSKGDGEDGDEEESIPALTMVADRLLKLSNLSESTSRESLREFFSSHSIDIAYVDFARGQTSAVIRLLSEKESGAKEVAQYLQEKKENIDGAEVSVSVLEGEEEKNYWEEMKKKQAERRERSSSKRGRGSRRGRGRGGRGRGGRGRGRGRGKRQRSD